MTAKVISLNDARAEILAAQLERLLESAQQIQAKIEETQLIYEQSNNLLVRLNAQLSDLKRVVAAVQLVIENDAMTDSEFEALASQISGMTA